MIKVRISEQDLEIIKHERFNHLIPRVQRHRADNALTCLAFSMLSAMRWLCDHQHGIHQCIQRPPAPGQVKPTVPRVPISIVLDNARYQKCKLAQATANLFDIELLYLLAYSPNLNLIQGMWKFVKKEIPELEVLS